jgi:Fe-S-cluster containining protein
MTADHRLVQIIDLAVQKAVQSAADQIACRKGCSHCCFGPFLITDLDGKRLRTGLASLDKEAGSRIQARALEAKALMESRRSEDHDVWQSNWKDLPCPVLDLETNECLLHAHRPIACRLHGPALSVDGVSLQPCRLNYSDLSAAQIEALRVKVNPGGVEELALQEHTADGGMIGMTYIAFALVF